MIKKNTLLDSKRFKYMEEDKIRFLRNLTEEKAIKMIELLNNDETWAEFKKFFTDDNPVSLKIGLRSKK